MKKNWHLSPAVNHSDTADFVVVASLQHLGHCLCRDCPVCKYLISSFSKQSWNSYPVIHNHNEVIEPTCADCAKQKEGSKGGSRQGARQECLPSPKITQMLCLLPPGVTSTFTRNGTYFNQINTSYHYPHMRKSSPDKTSWCSDRFQRLIDERLAGKFQVRKKSLLRFHLRK